MLCINSQLIVYDMFFPVLVFAASFVHLTILYYYGLESVVVCRRYRYHSFPVVSSLCAV